MSLRILLAFPASLWDLTEDIRRLLDKELLVKEVESDVIIRKNINSARECLENYQYDFHLIMVYLHLPTDRISYIDTASQLGLAFLQELQNNKHAIPSILVAPDKDSAVSRAVKKLNDTVLVIAGVNMLEELLQHAKKRLKILYQKHTVKPKNKSKIEKIFGLVDIWLDLDFNFPSHFFPGKYDMRTNSGKSIYSGSLFLSKRTLMHLLVKVKGMKYEMEMFQWEEEGCYQWEEDLRRVGETFKKELFQDRSFEKNFQHLKKIVGGSENITFNFRLRYPGRKDAFIYFPKDSEILEAMSIEPEQATLMLEAMVLDGEDYLMLQNPVLKNKFDIKYLDLEYPLFNERVLDESINCLIIEADTYGKIIINNKEIKLPLITEFLRLECDWLVDFLGKKPGNVKIGKVQRINKASIPRNITFKNYVKKVLKEDGPWQLVHFAGHFSDRTGDVFLPKDEFSLISGDFEDFHVDLKEDIECVNSDEFCLYLRSGDPRFIYLSSCGSSGIVGGGYLINIPAVVGFRWPIENYKARLFTEKFYEKLFEEKDFFKAFKDARRYFYEKFRSESKIWAAPVMRLEGKYF